MITIQQFDPLLIIDFFVLQKLLYKKQQYNFVFSGNEMSPKKQVFYVLFTIIVIEKSPFLIDKFSIGTDYFIKTIDPTEKLKLYQRHPLGKCKLKLKLLLD